MRRVIEYMPPSFCEIDLRAGEALGAAANSFPPLPAAPPPENFEYTRPGVTPSTNFNTSLSPEEEASFRKWVAEKNVPFNPDAAGPQDYDMRGFFRGLMRGDSHATTGFNPNDKQLHFSDWWKTPYHESFSAESQWADPRKAPRWNQQDQLVTPSGTVLFDERARTKRK